MLSEQQFRLESDRALEHAQRALMPLADEHDFEIELQNGVLQIAFEQRPEGAAADRDAPAAAASAKFIVSPNAPVRQMWVSAMARGYKLSWSPERSAFVLDGEPLDAFLARLVRQFLQIP